MGCASPVGDLPSGEDHIGFADCLDHIPFASLLAAK